MVLKVPNLISLASIIICKIALGDGNSVPTNEKLNETPDTFRDIHDSHAIRHENVSFNSNINDLYVENSFEKSNESYVTWRFVNKTVLHNKWDFMRMIGIENSTLNPYNVGKDILQPMLSRRINQNIKELPPSQRNVTRSGRCILFHGENSRKCLRKIKKLTNSTSTTEKLDSDLHLENNPTFLENTKDKRKRLISRPNFRTQKSNNFRSPTQENNEERNNNDIPCSCYWHHQTCGCNCTGSLNYDNFQNLSSTFIPCHNFTFSMNGGHHYALPPNLFSNLRLVINFNFFITNATFEYLCDPTPLTSPFTDVRFVDSALIRLKNVSVRRGWNWTPFVKLKGVKEAHIDIIIEDSILRRLTSDFSNIGNGIVETIDVANSKLSMIGSSAFETFVNMTHFRVPDNKISSIRRTDFPKMALKLEEIDLRNNLLNHLNEDLFSDMPSLKEISLSGNPLKELSEQTFHDVIIRVKLRGVSEFPLNCDCKLKWLKDSKMSDKAMIEENLKGATCKKPRHLRGVPFEYLSKEHLMCF